MKTKKQAFDIPFIGYDYGKDYSWDFDVLFGQYGNPIIGIKIKNIVEQYLTTVKPMHYLYVEPTKNFADLIINSGLNDIAFDVIKRKIQDLLEHNDVDTDSSFI